MTNYEDIEQVLVDKLTALGVAQKFDTYEVDAPVGVPNQTSSALTLPFVVIDFGGKGQQPVGVQGITGTRDDMKYTSVVFEIVSANPAVTRMVCRIIRDNFEGFSPDSTWGELVERIASPLYNRQASTGGELYPPRYARSIAYVVDVDA